MSEKIAMPCGFCGQKPCVCVYGTVSDSTFSGKPLTMPPGKFEAMEQHMENAALDEVRKEGFQAGLKKAAEIVSDFAAYRTTSEGKPEWGVLLEQAILKGANGD